MFLFLRNFRPLGGQDLSPDFGVRGRHVPAEERHRHGVLALPHLRRRHRLKQHPVEASRAVLQRDTKDRQVSLP